MLVFLKPFQKLAYIAGSSTILRQKSFGATKIAAMFDINYYVQRFELSFAEQFYNKTLCLGKTLVFTIRQ